MRTFAMFSRFLPCSFAVAAWMSRIQRPIRVLVIGMAIVTAFAARAQTDSMISSSGFDEPTAPGDTLQPREVERWADEIWGKAFEEHRFSALMVAVTQGNRVLLTKGYGYADWASKTPVDPDRTQFRIGSTSKTFTATAVAQLLERGLIESLDDPVNKYLKRAQLEKAFGEDVTIWDLLTHRAGFEDTSLDRSGFRQTVPVTPEIIAASTPRIVRQRDTASVYSNFGVAMLGILVEDITGQVLEEYFRKNIYEPLGMTNTVLAYGPVPTPDLAKTYAFVENQPAIPVPHRPLSAFIAPAGSVNSTASDMAKYLIAHIEGRHGAEPAILKPETLRLMHRRHAGNHPDQSGFGMLFMTYTYNGEPIVEHSGNTGDFKSVMIMMLNRRIGVSIVAANAPPPAGWQAKAREGNASPVHGAVQKPLSNSGVSAAVLRHFLGPAEMPESAVSGDIARYLGLYRNNRRNYSKAQLPGILNPSSGLLEVTSSGDGGLTIGGTGPYRQTEPHIFAIGRDLPLEASFYESARYAFSLDPSGKVTDLYGYLNVSSFERLAGWANPYYLRSLLLVVLAVCSTGVLAVLWRPASRWHRAAKHTAVSIGVVTIGGIIYGLVVDAHSEAIGNAAIPIIVLANVLTILIGVMVITTLMLWFHSLRDADAPANGKPGFHYAAIALAGLPLIAIFNYMNLIGFHVPGSH